MSQQHNVPSEICRTAGGTEYIFFVNMNIVYLLLFILVFVYIMSILLIRFCTALTHLISVLLTLWIRNNPSQKYCIGHSLTSTLSSIVWTSAQQWHDFSRVSIYTASVYICLLLCRPTYYVLYVLSSVRKRIGKVHSLRLTPIPSTAVIGFGTKTLFHPSKHAPEYSPVNISVTVPYKT